MNLEEFERHVYGFAQSDLSGNELVANFALGLAGESGEVVDLLKKYLYHGTELDQEKLTKELGDVLWYWVAICQCFDLPPENIMQANFDKLQRRHGGSAFNREVMHQQKPKEDQ